MNDELNPAFKALSDPTRRSILALLREKRLSAGEIAEEFDISKASISHHLKVLKHAGLVASERDGQRRIYSLKTTVLQDVTSWIFDVLPELQTDNGSEEGAHE